MSSGQFGPAVLAIRPIWAIRDNSGQLGLN